MTFPASRTRRTRWPAPAVAALLAGALALAGCGGGHGHGHGPSYAYGSVVLDNISFEYVDGFFLAPAATGLFTGDLLSSPLPPDASEWVGDFLEDLYDAEADLEFGDLVQWFDVFVPGGETTFFEVY